MTNYSRSVLKSNGFHHSENLPVKFGFSSKSVPANIAKKLPSQRCSQPFLIAFFNFSHKWPTFAFTPKAGTHPAFGEKSHTSAYTAKQGLFRVGVVSLPSASSARSRTSPGRVSERRTLPLLGLGRRCSRRTQKACGTAMRLCVSLFRGVAAPLGCVIFFYFCQNCDFYALRTQGLSVCARRGWYHSPRCALHVLKTPDGRLQKRLICCFLRPGSLH